MLWGYQSTHPFALDVAIAEATYANIPVVVAAGNQDSDACWFSPSRAEYAITVGATNWLTIAPFSNYGKCVDIFAHGIDVLSTDINCESCLFTKSGTSSAAAQVAGVAAIYLARNLDHSEQQVKDYILDHNAQNGFLDLNGNPETPNKLLHESCQFVS